MAPGKTVARACGTLAWALLCLVGCPAPTVPREAPQVRDPAPRNQLRVRFFAAGHGDAILLWTADGHRVLVDAGRVLGGDHLVRRRLIPYFKKRGIKKLDAFVVTHPHSDHFGDPVLLRKHVTFDTIYTNADGAVLLRMLAPGLRRAGGPVRISKVARGDRLQFGALRLHVLHPAPDALPPSRVTSRAQQNNRSLVIRATYGAVKILLTGDLTTRGETAVMAQNPYLYAQVLKLGHHGQGSTSDAWLRRVRPRYAVATCGDYLGRMRRVSPALVARLRQHKVKLYRTDLHGDVEVITDGRRITMKTHPEHIYRPRLLR